MARDRKCILCETVHVSKQEMDEHMRSMLHHRELEKLKGRDCGHECRVCKLTVASLTDYAGHISSLTHKQNAEAAERTHAANGREEDYFDQVLVDLIEKRKEQLRKEKEAAAAKLAKEEADRKKKEEMRLRLMEAKERYRLDRSWNKPPQRYNGSNHQSSWYRSNQYNGGAGEGQPWHHANQGKSATWHAQEPPSVQKWASGQFAGGSLHGQDGWGNKQWDKGAFNDNQRSRLPWLSNGGSSNGVYGQNNISQSPQMGRPLSLVGPPSVYPKPPSFLTQTFNQFQSKASDQGGEQGNGLQSEEGQTAEPDHNGSKSSKTLGSNPKLDKTCRWSPYPVTKSLESLPHKDSKSNSLEKFPKGPKLQSRDKSPETRPLKRQSQPEQKPRQSTSGGQSVGEKDKSRETEPLNRQSRPEQKPRPPTSGGQSSEEKGRHKKSSKTDARDRSSSSSSSRSSSSAQRDGLQVSGSSSSTQKKTLPHKDGKTASILGLSSEAQPNKASGQAQSKAPKQSGFPPQAAPVGPLQSRKERQLPETLRKARQIVLEKRGSLDSSRNNRMETEHQQSRIGVNKENNCRRNASKPGLPESVRAEKSVAPSSDSSQFLQSLHVSTSTVEGSEAAAASVREDEGKGKKDDATQAAEAGQSSESDNSRSGDVSGSNGLSKLDLPPALKRDLNKHISSKGKAGSHEPNLNIARRVRNVGESRRSDAEKDSGLKPTVRQLISSSGSRRNVNWEQVYQEVRKKQDKGKGMPRFGIEMVPLDQEDQSQEEDGIPLLEGFQWDSLTDASASRKRSLSESSIAPASTYSLFTPLAPKETPQRGAAGPEPQGSSAPEHQEDQKQVEQMLGQFEAKAEKQPDEPTPATVKALQRSDSVLGDSSSGTEQHDGAGTGKRRRAAGDVPSVETSFLEHNSKRRKVKSKKDRLHIDQLLAVSLREEELSRSLQTVDTSIIQARAALQAAYMEVQRLMVAKEQMTGEMDTLRNKRIELLKGMQGSLEDAPQLKLKEEAIDLIDVDPRVAATAAAAPCPSPPAERASPVAAPCPSPPAERASPVAAPCPSPPAERASPPASRPPVPPVVVKQEPQSPVHVSWEPDPVDDTTHCAHSTTPELHARPPAANSPPDLAVNVKPELFHAGCSWEPADVKESPPESVETAETATQATRGCVSPPPDVKPPVKPPSAGRRDSEVGSVGDSAATHSFEPPAAPHAPASPSELKNGKRVRKLKKRKVLKKAQGAEQPESSDTELDGEVLRPRWLWPRRRPSGSSQVSTSTPPSEDVNMEAGEDASALKDHFKSPQLMAAPPPPPPSPPAELTLNLDSEESMEVAPPQPHADAPPAPTSPPVQVPDTSRPEPQSLACNEVTSTSDMDVCRSSESDVQYTFTSRKTTKTSSDASSDHGEDDLPTEGAFEGHQEAVNAMQIHSGLLYTCSGDRTVRAFDLVSRKCVGVFEGHGSKVSCLLVSVAPSLHHRLYSGSSDQTIRCYSLKTRELEQQFSLSDRVLCLHSRWQTLYAGLANGTVVTFSLKTNKQMDVFECHGPRAVSCLASSQEGARRILLVGSYDSTISVRDAKSGLLLRTLEGHTKTVLCMKVVNDLVFSGSSDQCVHAHNIHTGEVVRVYKGHSHAVTVVSVLGKVMVTACLDKLVRVYDLQSQEQLQVYGGHKDMVMCMVVHKNLIYTGGYDGSVQAVKLNLLQSRRCWWHGCSLAFGMTEHLRQHLLSDHASAKVQTLRCRWKNCDEFFCTRNRAKQGMPVHMQKHAEEETDPEA